MSTLTEFLLARIDEDEADLCESRINDMPEWWAPDAWSRERGLIEVEAKRRIVEEHRLADWDAQGHPICETCVSPDDWTVTGLPPHLIYPCRTLRILASVYSDHPDYRDEWKP